MGFRHAPIKAAASVALVLLIAINATALFSRNQAYNQAGQVAAAIPEQVKALHPTVPPDARLIFVGVPDQVPEGPLVYLTGFHRSMQLAYQRTLQILKLDKFPIWLDELDRIYLFQVDHRRVIERTDLSQALVERKNCLSFSRTTISWDFADAQGWEPWNQLEGFETREGQLLTRSEGNDPFMGSPPVDIPSIMIGDVQITMSVRASQPTAKGELYWLVSGQRDFSPGLQESFAVQADGQLHTYAVNLIKSNKLAIGDRIVQFRLDPVDAPAQIAIQSIRVSTQCDSLEGEHCKCAQ